MKNLLFICFVFLSVLMGCQNRINELSEEDINAIRELHAKTETAVFLNNWDDVLKYYTDDAIQIAPRERPVIGKKEIANRLYQLKFDFLERDNVIQEINGNNDIAYYWSTLTQKIQKENSDSVSVSGARMLRILKKQEDGTWLVSHDIWNYDNK